MFHIVLSVTQFTQVIPSNESLTPIDLSGDEEPSGSGADDESLDSSMTNSSIQFEEIDDVLQVCFYKSI